MHILARIYLEIIFIKKKPYTVGPDSSFSLERAVEPIRRALIQLINLIKKVFHKMQRQSTCNKSIEQFFLLRIIMVNKYIIYSYT